MKEKKMNETQKKVNEFSGLTEEEEIRVMEEYEMMRHPEMYEELTDDELSELVDDRKMEMDCQYQPIDDDDFINLNDLPF